MPPSRVGWQNEYVKQYIPTQTPDEEKWPSNHHADIPLYVGPDTWSYLPYRDNADVVKYHKSPNP